MIYICDTNFILRYLLADDQAMFIESKEIFDKAQTNEIGLIIEQTVFTEVIFVLSSVYKVPKDRISEILSELLTYKGLDYDKDVMLLALKYYDEQNLHIVDCLLAARSKISHLPLLTFDQKLTSFCRKL